ncbi:MAG: DUF2029 domain-containing protein [Deltaproteobacteria bacterium]|nr:DUF2029 domain-containing protein [Deltaproteobacteria bacterium]
MDGIGQNSGGWSRWLVPALTVVLFGLEMARAPSVHQDFAPLYAAAVLATEGRLADAYATDPVKLKRAGPVLTDTAHEHGYPIRHVSRYLHAPAVAMLCVPFTALTYPFAAYLFRTLSLLALVASAFMLARLAGWNTRTGPIVLVALLFFDPARMTLDLGQTNLMVLALVLYGLSSRAVIRSGLALGVAALLKTFVLAVPLVWLAAGGDDKARRAGLTAVLTLAILNAAAYLVSPEGTFAWADSMAQLSHFQFLWPEQQSLASQVVRVMHGYSAADVTAWTHAVVATGSAGLLPMAWALAVGALAALLAVWRRPDTFTSAVLAICAGLLASPVLHSHYGLMLAVAAAWVVRRGRWDVAAGLCLAGFALQAVPLHSAEGAFWVPLIGGAWVPWVFCSYRLVGVALAFAGACLAVIRKSEATGASAPSRTTARVRTKFE